MALVLLPGVMCDTGLWQAMVEDLAPYGPLVYGDLSQDATLAEMAARVLAAAPEHFTLLGFSMGGYVAREMVRQAPLRVERLILIATSSRQDSEQAQAFKAATAKTLMTSSGIFSGLSHNAIALSLSEQHADCPRLQQQIHAMSLRVGKETYCRQLLMPRPADTDLLAQIACPTLVIAAADDRMRTQRESQILADNIAGATLQVIDNTGHMVPLEQPKALAAVITRWLQAHTV